MRKFSVFRDFVRLYSSGLWWHFVKSESTLQDLLDVADVLNKAISSVPAEQLEQSQSLKDLHQGLQLTESQLLNVFSKHGLVQENPMGQKFDPNKHDALFQVLNFEKNILIRSLLDPGPWQGSQHRAGCTEDWLHSARKDHQTRGSRSVEEIGESFRRHLHFFGKGLFPLYDNSVRLV